MDSRVRHSTVPESEGNGVENHKPIRETKKQYRFAETLIALSMLLALAVRFSRRRAMSLRWTGIGERGQSMVEFALMLPVLMVLLMGVMDFGRAFYFNNTISNMAREGARYATMYARPSGNEYGRQLPAASEVIAYTHRYDNGLTVVVTVEYDGDGDDDNQDSDGDGHDDDEDDDDDNDGEDDDEDDDDDGDGVDDEYDGDHDNDGDGYDDDEDDDDDNDGCNDDEDEDDDGNGIDDDDEEHDEGYRQMSGIRVTVTVRTTYAPITPFVPNSFSMSSKAVMLTE